MIVHIFNERMYVSQNLSSKNGTFPLSIDGRIVANFMPNDEEWTIQLSSDYYSQDIQYNNPKLEPYHIYSITSRVTGEQFYLIPALGYNPNIQSFDLMNQVSIGSNINCDIYLPLSFNKNDFIRISLINSRWIAETNSRNFFISGNRLKNGQEVLSGDYIFFFGLKLIFLNSKIIVDDPKNLSEIRFNRLRPSDPIKTQPVAEVLQEEKTKDNTPLYTEKDYFYRAPRLNYIIEKAVVEIDEPPEPERDNAMPAIVQIGPQLTMAAASALSMTGFIMTANSSNRNGLVMGITISTMFLSMIGALLWPFLSRRFNKRRIKKREEKRQKKYEKYLGQKQHLIDFIKANQKQTLLDNNPAPQQCLKIVESRSKELWQRSAGHNDFLKIRLGLGKVETELSINRPKEKFSVEDDDTLFLAMKKAVNDALLIEDAPITYDLTNQNIDAIVGDQDSIKRFMDCVFLQLLTFHSYTDLKIVTFTKDPAQWSYLKTIPHAWDNLKKTRYFTSSVEKFSTLLNELEKVFDARTANDEEVRLEDDGARHESETTYKDFKPYYLFFIDDMSSARNLPLINKILHYKRNMGFSIIATAENVSMLPNETSDFIVVSRQNSAIVSGDTSRSQKLFSADFNDGKVNMHQFAQHLANIPIRAEKGKYELPSSISFLELYNYGKVEQLNSLARWKSNNPSNSLSVPIGIDQNSEIFQMDIHERAFGPHGLVAGTTGSGKSEWIVTYILSLAVNFSPDEVQFVLIDYKGGGLAKSFENAELGIKLPHLAGTITNLDKSDIFRSIAAIESELKRRQAIFNDAREKLKEGSMNIYKYQQYYRKGKVDVPLSHLLIICDEFAELKQQEPDFMEQLISTSRIGRSLGVHLILATQKPSGVVNDQIWSNSKFKVCLKVQDKSDSNEILKRPDAAFLKQTGTFYLQVGNNDYFNLGQVAWAGAKYYPSDYVEHSVDDSVQCIDDTGQIIATYKETGVVRESQGEELLNIVAYISEISKQITIKSGSLWLENINPRILLSDIIEKYQVEPSEKYTYETVIGEYDEPRKQMQGVLKIDLAGGNIAIVGKADSSVEKLVSTMIWSSICDKTPAEIAYYLIDFGAETLRKFANFPHVGEVVSQDELDKVAGVLSLIVEEMDRRKEILTNYNGSFEYYNKVEQNKMNLIVVVINNYDIFGEVLPRSLDLLNEMFRDAPKYGIIFVVTSNTTNALGSRITQFFNHYILLQINDDTQYRGLTNCRRGLIPKKFVGRGICKLDPTSDDSYCEFQTAMIAPEEQELDIIRTYADQCVDYYKCKVKQLAQIPDDMTSNDLMRFVSDLANVPIGFDISENDIAKYDLASQKLHLVTAKNINDNINFIYALADLLSQVQNTKVRVVDLLGIFKKPILDIRLFDEEPDLVFGALEKDVLNRTDTQDYSVNLIVGAGHFKEKLSQGGIEIFRNLFEHLPESKKSIYVLIDSYDKLRTLKLEKWFTDVVNSSQGLWLGEGFGSQTLIESDAIREEDKKYDFPGLAFSVKDGQYKAIKTMMDEDE